MIVNQQALQGVYTSFSTIFNKFYAEATPKWSQVATLVPSETGEESYKWLGSIPKMREWIGERHIQNLSAYDYTLKNKDFEVTVALNRNDVDDDKLGIYAPMVQSMAQSAALYPDDLVFELLKNGFSNPCYDGKSFFSTEHKVGKKAVSNKGTAKLSATSYGTARSEMMSYLDDKGKTLRVIPNLLVVPPALESKAREILMADQIGGTTNIYKGTAKLLVVPELAGKDTAWYLLSTTMALKPLIFQERKKPQFTSFTNPGDPMVFLQKEYLYGTDARGNAGYGFWQMAYGSDGSAT